MFDIYQLAHLFISPLREKIIASSANKMPPRSVRAILDGNNMDSYAIEGTYKYLENQDVVIYVLYGTGISKDKIMIHEVINNRFMFIILIDNVTRFSLDENVYYILIDQILSNMIFYLSPRPRMDKSNSNVLDLYSKEYTARRKILVLYSIWKSTGSIPEKYKEKYLSEMNIIDNMLLGYA